jgi:type IV secretory pathway VirB2 component (pilin)
MKQRGSQSFRGRAGRELSFFPLLFAGLKEGSEMVRGIRLLGYALAITAVGLTLPAPALAQANSPWESAVNVLQQAFTGSIARGLSLVAIVVSGLTFAFGEGGSKRVLAGVLFGVGMAIAAVNFLAWLFPG